MATFEIPNLTGGVDDALVDVSSTVGSFFPMMLVFLWVTVFLSGNITQFNRVGRSDPASWSVVASMITLVVTLLLTLKDNVINITILGTVYGVVILSGLWLFLSRRNTEV